MEVVKTSGIVEDSELAEGVQWTVEDTERLKATLTFVLDVSIEEED